MRRAGPRARRAPAVPPTRSASTRRRRCRRENDGRSRAARRGDTAKRASAPAYGMSPRVPPVHLPARTKILYGIGSVAYGVKDNGFQFFLLLYYNQVLGLPQEWVGLGIMVALLIDALIDPLV